MARAKMFEDSGAKADMSPMIDLVFLLLIFFLLTARMVTYPKDQDIKIPIASEAMVPKDLRGRVYMNITSTGTIRDINGAVLSLSQFENVMTAARASDEDTRLHLRADHRALHGMVKDVVEASAKAGVVNTVFSTYQVE